MNTLNKQKKENRLWVFPILSVVLFAVFFYLGWNESHALNIPPASARTDLSGILDKQTLSDADYRTVFEQTGLGRPAVDGLPAAERKEKILSFQEQFFAPRRYRCSYLLPTTREDFLIDAEGNDFFAQTVPLQNGYLLVGKSSHTLGWRHGHCAFVVDAAADETLEAVRLGTQSRIEPAGKWWKFTSFAVLRPKNVDQETLDQIAANAKETLCGLDYHLTAGIFSETGGTQCSHLMCLAYEPLGLDFTGFRPIITPDDFLNSDQFEIVQIYGMDPMKFK